MADAAILTPRQRAWRRFAGNRRGWWSLWIFLALFGLSLFAELLSNDKPIVAHYQGEYYFPLWHTYPETTFGGDFRSPTDYLDPFIRQQLSRDGNWALYPPNPYRFDTLNYFAQAANPAPPSADNLLGTDDRGRDVLARLLYGFRVSVLFALALTAIAHQQLDVHYQPQVQAASGRVCGVEALLRWPHPTRGQVSPLKFIPIAEESGLIEALGAWVLRQACQQVAHWKSIGIHGVRMAVNLSAHQLRSRQLVDTVREAMHAHGVQAGELELEITESAVMKDPQAAIDTLQQLRDLGVHLAIDDFGTGYSSLAYLKLLPVDVLKIDRSFVKDIETDRNDAAICASILALAKSLGLKVVAEGVETAAQRDFLDSHGCDYLQGYFFAKPQPAALCAEQWRQAPALPAPVNP